MKERMKSMIFLVFSLAVCMSVSGQAIVPPEKGLNKDALKTNQWEFENFGAKASGTVKYENQKMTISTQKTRNCFFESDAYSFAYQKQSFPYDDCSKSTVTVKIGKFSMGSAGIMMRSSRLLGASNAHLETNATGDLFLFCRKNDDASTSYSRIANLPFPMEIKLVRQGNVFTGYYKDGTGNWIKGASAIAEVGPESYIGFYACSGSESQIGYETEANTAGNVSFYDWTSDYEENYIPAEKNFVDRMPVKEGTMLRDNFDDGSLSNLPKSITNPVWAGIKSGMLPYDKAGGRYWRKVGDGLFTFGDKKWADYQVALDLSFDKASILPNEFLMQLRYQNISIYSKMLRYYAVGLRDGNKVFFEKYESGNVTLSKVITISSYFDETKHNLKVRLLDRKYEVYYDGKLIIEGEDLVKPITYGNITLKFTNAAMNIDNLEVLRIEDPINGSTDNYLQDYFDTPAPAFLKKYGY
ncbi:MAG: hypothetical protein PHS30_00070 [Bacteroidales bacterium]|nr:hypothetical protein [Bacteroidales bacterium]